MNTRDAGIITLPLPPKPITKEDEIILLLQAGMLRLNRKLWYTIDQLQEILKEGGLPLLPEKAVQNALRGDRRQIYGVRTHKFRRKTWYCFASSEPTYDTPTAQFKILESLKKEKHQDEIDEIKSPIPFNHFDQFVAERQGSPLRKYLSPKDTSRYIEQPISN